MLGLYVLFCYLIGIITIYNSIKSEKELRVIDILMFIVSPFSMTSMMFIKVVSHFIDLDKIIIRTED